MKFTKIINPFIEDFKNKNRGIVWAFLSFSLLFLLYIYFGKNAFLYKGGYGLLGGESQNYFRYIGWFFSCFFVFFAIPVIFIGLHPKLKLKNFGLGIGDYKFTGKIAFVFTAFMLILVAALIIFKSTAFLRYYPMFAKGISKANSGSFVMRNFLTLFLVYEVSYFIYFIGWEFFFRGLLIFPLANKLENFRKKSEKNEKEAFLFSVKNRSINLFLKKRGRNKNKNRTHIEHLTALIGVLPFAIMHLRKPVPEVFGSIIAAYFLGLLALKAKSFWITPIIHFLIAFSMDFSAALSRGLL